MEARSGYQINALTTTRAVAALMVFIHHFGTGIYPFSLAPSFFHSGNIAVGYFFVLSGFVLYISYYNKDLSYAGYIKRRVGKIVPMYLLALLLAIFVAVAYYHYDLFALRSLKEMTFSVLFIQAFIPGYPLVLNGPGWTISIEMFFYVLFPLLLTLQKKKNSLFITLTVAMFILSQYFHLTYFADRYNLSDNIVDTVFFSPQIHLSQFLLGMIGGQLFNTIKNTAPKYKLLSVMIFAVIVLLIAFRPEHLSYQVGLIAPVFMIFIVSIAINNPRILNTRALVYMGEISYCIYILQQPIYKFFDVINTRYMHITAQYFFYLALIALLIVSSVTYYFVEQPLRRKIASLSLNKA